MSSIGAFVGGCVTLFFSCAISAAGGVGGGGINVPILLLIFQYSLKTSIALSLCVVLGNAFAQTLLNLQKRHPKRADKPLIFWELVLMLLPAQMGGSNIGTILSAISPDSIIYVLALTVLFFASSITTKKGMHKWHEENAKAAEDVALQLGTSETLSPFAETGGEQSPHDSHLIFELDVTKKEKDATKKASDSLVALKWPLQTLQVIGVMWVCYTCILIGRVLVNKCSVPYVICYICMYIPLIGALVASFFLNTADSHKTTSRVNEVDLNANIFQLICAAFSIGVVCSLLGIGGGELMSPLILSYHVSPQVTSATTAIMSFLNTLSNLIRSSLRNEYPVGAGMILIVVGFFGGLCGRYLGLYFSAKYNRSSMIVFSLAGVLYLTCLYYIATLATTDFDLELNDYC